MRANIKSFRQGADNIRATLRPTEEQIRAATRKEVTALDLRAAKREGFRESAEAVHASRTREEEMVQELILQWQTGAHDYIPEIKEDNILQLGCKNVNSLSLYNPKGSKMRKLINIHQKYQTDGACIVEHGINFCMSSNGNCPSDLFARIRGSRVSAAHNVHEAHGRYQQGGTMNVAFTCLASYVKDTGVDHTGLGRWSWIQVGTGEHRTQIVSAYQ